MSELPKITALSVPRNGVLDVTWRDGTQREVDVSSRLTRHPMLIALRDPDLFAQAEIDEWGGGVCWPNGADFCADAMRLWAEEQHQTRQTA